MSASEELRRRYVDILRNDGVLLRDDLAGVFGVVPREVFVAGGFHYRDGTWVAPDDPGFLDTVYSNDVLVTKIIDGAPVSSSSQPSLMALMLEALDPAPGMRVLEIGTGTGYNAALMAAMGVRVTSVDAQTDVVNRAAEALRRAGAAEVEVRVADGYLGDPAGGGGFDRVIATVGVSGVSPHWLHQLAPGGFVIAPVAHAGNHPVLRVCPDSDGRIEAEAICHAGFMSASGPLSARYPGAHPEPVRTGVLPAPTLAYPGCWRPPLNGYRYHDLWFAAGAWDRRVTSAALAGAAGAGGCTLLDDTRSGGAGIMVDGVIVATGQWAPQYGAAALALRNRWMDSGEPAVPAWRASMMLAGDPDQPIWVPRDWSLRQPG